jgi:hypothetical protein
VPGGQRRTSLQYCRVDGEGFWPVTIDSTEQDQFYAVLKLGDQCPNGAIEISVFIDNEDGDARNTFRGPIYPNEVVSGVLGTTTKLFFCYFRAAPAREATMPSFPNLGFPYAVYHAYEGDQPGWVLSKSWFCTRGEQAGRQEPHPYGPPGQIEIFPDFRNVIQQANRNSCFHMARVR